MLRSDQGHVRLGRECLQVGRYIELAFPSCGVDSLYESTNDFTPFRNISKDCSNKGRAAMKLTGPDTSRPFATYHRTHGEKRAKARFICSNYRKNSKTTCSIHGIREEDIYAIVLDDLRRVTHFARQNERKFAEYIGMKRTKEAQKKCEALKSKSPL